MQPAIQIKNLGKQYKLDASEPYIALRDVISNAAKNLLTKKKAGQKFWALKNIDLDIMPGERIGIIGRNGAGKSTLLKIISRITPPTTGEAMIRGRVGSLLEVGTGFHPELTGRENIYLNGSILGLKKAEINRQLDAIIDFSGVEKFIDTPLKHYSIGMQMRLAFSVAAHLESEILLIDEVLAVGDLEFQRKCIGKMEEISTSEGRTVLFVSHNMNYITALCNKGVLLSGGEIIGKGPASEIVQQYINEVMPLAGIKAGNEISHDDVVRFRKLHFIDRSGEQRNYFSITDPIGIQMEYEVLKPGHVIWLGYNLFNESRINVFDTHSVNTPFYETAHEPGIHTATAWIPGNLLNAGNYLVGCAAFNHTEHVIHFHEKEISLLSVQDTFDGNNSRGKSGGDFPGVIRPLLDWEIKKTDRQ
jgi:lipopolysaccharide transport system ATP-binding protein